MATSPRDYLPISTFAQAYSNSSLAMCLASEIRRLLNTIDLGFFLNIGSPYSIGAGDVKGMIFV